MDNANPRAEGGLSCDLTGDSFTPVLLPSPCRELDPVDDTTSSRPVCIVGIGASAGGLEALERFFDRVPHDRGLAFVVVMHLSPDFKSVMDELLARHTELAIHRVEDGMAVEPNSLYLIPPNKEMIISDGRLLLSDRDDNQSLSLPIDVFFRSLAENAGPRAAAVVLSGTGSDGSRGVRAVHDAGGLVLVQSEETAKFDGMPRAAIDTGVADAVLSPEAMPDAILDYVSRGGEEREPWSGAHRGLHGISRFAEVFALLRETYRIDFSHYKPNTITRRIERRLSMGEAVDLDDYVHRLQTDPEELNALYRDLLIGVTRFFRDPEAFARLQQDVIPRLVQTASPERPLRVWAAGCATGEEAYSMAILLHEEMSRMQLPLNAQVFATDVHRESLEVASAGVYSAESVSHVGAQRLDRYFIQRGDQYQVCKDLRQMIVFAPHNVIRDAPFTKIDLIVCRNLLIYLEPAVQKKVLSLFHFALNVGGALFLGPSESISPLADEFETLDEHWRLFRKKRNVRLPADLRAPLGATEPRVRGPVPALPTPGPGPCVDLGLLRAYDAILADYVPPSLLLNERRELVHTFGEARQFLHPPAGRTSLDVLDLVDEDLRVALAAAIQRTLRDKVTVVYPGVRARSAGDEKLVKLTVKPLPDRSTSSLFVLVVLKSLSAPAPEPEAEDQEEFCVDDASKERIRLLESELRYTKENLQATIEEFETANEELQATNEELVSSNEELQSTNEELHSVNEELHSVNAEYQRKNDELTELNTDMDNLLRSTEIGTVFLDRDLRIRKFTPAVEESFNLLPQDIGRPIAHIAHNVDCGDLTEELTRVLESGTSLEREVRNRNGRPFLMRIQPYRSEAGEIAGIVLTFVDIDGLKKAREALRSIEWLLGEDQVAKTRNKKNRMQPYGNLTKLNTCRFLSETIGEKALTDIAGSYLDVMETTTTVCEKNGDYALRIVASGWCRLLDRASRDLCETDDNAKAMASGDWHCHESCCNEATRACMKKRRRVDIKCRGGIRLAAVPIWAGKEIVGAISFGYGDPPRDPEELRKLADRFQVSVGDLRREAESYDSRPPFLVDVVKKRLATSAKLIGATALARRAERRLACRAEELAESNHELEQFAYVASHDLKEPLRMVSSYTGLLKERYQGKLDPEADKYIHYATDGAQRMQALIDALLDYSRVGRKETPTEEVDLSQVVDRAHTNLEATVQELDAKIEIGPLPTCIGDSTMLVQLFQNLIGNGMKFHDGAKPVVRVFCEPDGEMWHLSVEDNGIGIDPEFHEQVFGVFRRLHGRGQYPGTGIGLAICKKIVERHGGRIWLESTSGSGSTFHFTLPKYVGSSRVDLQACKLEYSIVSPK